MKTLKVCTLFTVILILFSCGSKSSSFIIEGNIEGAKNNAIYLIKRGLQTTSIIDSTVIKKNGSFKLKEAAQKYPEFYIL